MSAARSSGWGVILLCLAVGAVAQAEEEYSRLRARLETGSDTGFDYRRLRLAWAKSIDYRPDEASSLARQRALAQAIEAADPERGLAVARAWLAEDYVNPFAHVGAARLFEIAGQAERAAFHRGVAEGLQQSLCQAGEGQSPDRPCTAVSMTEVNYYLARRRLEIGSRYESACVGGRACAVFEVRELDTTHVTDLYFDISRPVSHRATTGSGDGEPASERP